ncbi:unnamed protein product [Closterium sp. Yama58-4]|nr:unnamed protein product [Closterium sp. Yama58-4]
MTPDKHWFEDLKELDQHVHVELANGSTLTSSMVGTIRAQAPDGTTVRYTEVLYVPGLKSNLLSYCQLLKKGARINANANSDAEITMPVEDGHVRIGLGKDVHGVLMVEYEPALTCAHGPGHTDGDAPSNAHSHGGLNGQSATASVTYRIAHMARVVGNMTRDGDKGTHLPGTFDDMLLDAETLLGHQQHMNEVSPHVAVWTSGGEGNDDGPNFGKHDLPGHDATATVDAAKEKGGAAANDLRAANVFVPAEDGSDTGSKVGYATTAACAASNRFPMAQLLQMVNKSMVLVQHSHVQTSRDVLDSKALRNSSHLTRVFATMCKLAYTRVRGGVGCGSVTRWIGRHKCVYNFMATRKLWIVQHESTYCYKTRQGVTAAAVVCQQLLLQSVCTC